MYRPELLEKSLIQLITLPPQLLIVFSFFDLSECSTEQGLLQNSDSASVRCDPKVGHRPVLISRDLSSCIFSGNGGWGGNVYIEKLAYYFAGHAIN